MDEFKMLFKKNLLLYRRRWFGSLLEIVIPIAICCLVLAIRSSVGRERIPGVSSPTPQMSVPLPTPLTLNRFMIKNCANRLVNGHYTKKSQIALIPENDVLVEKLAAQLKNLGYDILYFPTDNELDNYVKDSAYASTEDYPAICFGVTVDSSADHSYRFQIRYDSLNFESPDTIRQEPSYLHFDTRTLSNVAQSGSLGIANVIINYIAALETENQIDQIFPIFAPISVSQWTLDTIQNVLVVPIDLLTVIPLIIVYVRMTNAMLAEKQSRLRETMRIMGMSSCVYYLSWCVLYFLIYLIISVSITVILWHTLPGVHFEVILIMYLLFSLVLIVQSLFIQVFFTDSNLGILCALLFFFAQFILSFTYKSSLNPTDKLVNQSIVLPHSAMGLALRYIVYAFSYSEDVGFGNLSTRIMKIHLDLVFVCLICHIILWTLLFLYLNQVYPNEFGSRKPPLFFLSYFLDKLKRKPAILPNLGTNLGGSSTKLNTINNNFLQSREASSLKALTGSTTDLAGSSVSRQIREKNSQFVEIKGIHKTFPGGKKAVQNLSLKLYQGEIFTLLGHNGAGKTTTISMLTGMLMPDGGSITMFGMNYFTDLDKIRKLIGICPQHNTLYEDLTVKENLRLFATFKGYEEQSLIDAEVNELIKDVGLEDKADYPAGKLSGGQMRRLSTAIAFVGDSKIVFLDEPTAGMDPTARRQIWTMLKKYRHNRIIFLTTHFMDEVEYLSDQIGMMAEGQLRQVGTSLQLKQRAGIHYNLQIVKKTKDTPNEPILDLVKSTIPEAQLTSSMHLELTIKLPMNSMGVFSQLFGRIDRRLRLLGIQSYGVSITPLDQIFVAASEYQQKHGQPDDNFLTSKKELVHMGALLTFWVQTKSVIVRRIRSCLRDRRLLVFEYLFPLTAILMALGLSIAASISDPPKKLFDASVESGWATPINIPVSGPATTQTIERFTDTINSRFAGQLHAEAKPRMIFPQQFDQEYLHEYKNTLGIYLMQPFGTNLSMYYAFIDTRRDSSPFLLLEAASTAIISNMVNRPVEIEIYNHPLAFNYQQRLMLTQSQGMVISVALAIAISFRFGNLMYTLVRERIAGCKKMEMVAGMNLYAYWLGNFLYDYFMFLVVAVFSVGMVKAFGILCFANHQAYEALWAMVILYGLANTLFSYLASFIFSSAGVAQIFGFFFNIVWQTILPTFIMTFRTTQNDSTVSLINLICYVIPAYALGDGIMLLAFKTSLELQQKVYQAFDIYSLDFIGLNILYLGLQSFLFPIFLYCIQKFDRIRLRKSIQNPQSFVAPEQQEQGGVVKQDADVIQQKIKVEAAQLQKQSLIVKNMHRVYKPSCGKSKYAVKGVSFVAQKGQVFGLLGVNGAGKTSLFKMLAGEDAPTAGSASFLNHSIQENIDQIRKTMGYCPQFDSLFDMLTVDESLNYFYSVRGLPEENKQETVQNMLKSMNLMDFRNTFTSKLSGGNKRKLSVACSILGDPEIILLDEPTTGMDPVARRFLWKIINKIANKDKPATIILTTHLMEEAEALSSRMCIMISGKFRCLGTPQHLKGLYGQGYEIELKVKNPTENDIQREKAKYNLFKENETEMNAERFAQFKSLLKGETQETLQVHGKFLLEELQKSGSVKTKDVLEFIVSVERGLSIKRRLTIWHLMEKGGRTEVTILENFDNFFKLRVLGSKPSLLFELLQKEKQKLFIEYYSVKQYSIEQIFNNFVMENNNSNSGSSALKRE